MQFYEEILKVSWGFVAVEVVWGKVSDWEDFVKMDLWGRWQLDMRGKGKQALKYTISSYVKWHDRMTKVLGSHNTTMSDMLGVWLSKGASV